MELCLTLQVVVVFLPVDDEMVDIAEVDLGGALRLFVLEKGFCRDSSFFHAFGGHLNEDEVIIISIISPAKWISPSVELCFSNQIIVIGFSSKGSVIVELAKVSSLLPLDVLVVLWLIVALRLGVGLVRLVINLNSQWFFAPVLGHPVVGGCDWLGGSPVVLAVVVWMDVLDLGVSVPSFFLKVLGLRGSQVWLTGNWIWYGMWVFIEVELVNVDWAAIWGLDGRGSGHQGSNSQ